ncbi:MAG TPA: sigma 54-interacting transcriptional regulator [Thermoanaerobaculia bacterium]|nr:sigma 54-interacting transcriptional regulator [Thermoanaerobaculia bacterium]
MWWERFGVRERREAGLLEALARKGVECQALARSSDPPGGPGLLLFDAEAPELADWVRERSGHGQERVIAVGASREALSRGSGWKLLEAGASDVLAGDDPAIAEAVAARFERWEEVDRLVDSTVVNRNLVGHSLAWRSVLRQIVEVARFSSSTVLLGGESGTGKELVARLIHTLDPREDKRDLVTLDCTTVVPELSGSEFFGHERGSFTSAVASREGAVALADGGTLFLDEIGELPLRLQAELLRVVQEGTYKKVGSNAWQKARFRLVCATHRDLLGEVEEGRFRRDFYYRIAAWTCHLPPLRERREDIPALVRHFLRERFGDEAPEVDPEVLDLLLARDYPGNVRDLRQLVGRIAHRHVGAGPVTLGDVPEEERPRQGSETRPDGFEGAVRLALARRLGLKEIGNLAAETAIRLALEEEGGSLRRAAERLGVTDRALQMRRAARRSVDPDRKDG